ncbi:hypothetical protein ARMGADRAFT_1018272 [Armillaria gallica]|uniref:Uncharacterized protein n=1 Tax=Armillaria gallica TaxID=47427 RepID=A0A2H3D717_ARMGA|nr:hypothetical protein ARMGADRAFT_1018272 [Armillaria gallica]
MRSLPRYSYFADCKLYIRTRLLASAFSNFWNSQSHLTFCEDVTMHPRKKSVVKVVLLEMQLIYSRSLVVVWMLFRLS